MTHGSEAECSESESKSDRSPSERSASSTGDQPKQCRAACGNFNMGFTEILRKLDPHKIREDGRLSSNILVSSPNATTMKTHEELVKNC